MQTNKAYDRRWWALGVLCLSLLIISLDNTILNVALPTIERELSADSSQLQWIVDSYTLVFAGLLLFAGALGDRFGRRRALVLGLAIFGGASAWSAMATSADELIMSRAVMGIGGALIMPTTLSILTNIFPREERAKAIGIWAAVAGLGVAIGPVTGGWLIDQLDWTWVFLVNVPIAAAALLMAPIVVPESSDPDETALDPMGAALSIAGLGLLVWSIIEAGGERGWTDGVVLGGFGASVVLLGLFAAWEMRRRQPMLDMKLFRLPTFSGASLSIGLAFFSLFGAIYFLTQFLQGVMDMSPLEAGAGTTPVALGLVIGGPLSAKLVKRFGTRNIVAIGLVGVAAGLFLLAGLDVGSAYSQVALSVVVLGFGMGFTMAPATESIMSSLPAAHAGVGSAMNDAVRLVGGTFGVAILGSLLSSGYRGDMETETGALPAEAGQAAGDSLGGASAVADRIGGEAGALLNASAETAFTGAMSTALVVASAVALAGAALAFAVLPRHERKPAEATSAAVAEAAAA
jgi:EmrB/QacA subfamily drug resistance transporter